MKNALVLKPFVLSLLGLTLPALSFANIFQYCDHEYTLDTPTAFIESPYYPASYPANTACRYKLTAPIDTVIRATCEVYVDKGSGGCTTENVYVGTDGDPLLRGSENFCGQGNFTRTSIFNRFVLAYISEGSWGRFRCQFEVLPQACDCGWSVSQKIVNGVQANINEFPSMVALVDKSGSQQAAYCGGTIVSHRYIMTAAHCADVQRNPSLITAFVGDHNLASSSETLYADRYDILQIIKHPQYATTPDVVNDIAVLRTVKDILWSRGVGPICIPPTSYAYSNFDYRFVTITGWGTTSFGGPISNVLMKASLYTTTNNVCQENYQGIANVKSTQICTSSNSNQDTCQYDSGGPVIYQSQRQFQLGIISFGKPCGTGLPTIGVNTRVPSYSAWLNSVVGSGALCQKTM